VLQVVGQASMVESFDTAVRRQPTRQNEWKNVAIIVRLPDHAVALRHFADIQGEQVGWYKEAQA